MAAIIFGIVNALIGPILRLISLPLTIVTFGLFSIVVNYILFAITVWITPNFHNTGEINPWLANLYGAIIMMIVSTIMHQGNPANDMPATVTGAAPVLSSWCSPAPASV